MKKIYARLKENKLLFSVLINLIVLIAVVLIFSIKYEVSDDYMTESLVNGAYGTGMSIYLPFSSILYGFILNIFYHLYQGVNWYGIFLLLGGFISFVSVLYFLLNQTSWKKAMFLYVVFLLFFMEDIYISIQFTKVATLLIMTGSLLFIDGSFENHRKNLIIGTILVCWGSLVRFKCLYICGIFIVYILLVQGIRCYQKKIDLKNMIQIALKGIVLIALVFSLRGANLILRNSQEDYQRYYEYNSLRSNIVDYPFYGYDSHKEWCDEIGISENDFQAVISWNFVDNEYYSTDKMKAISDHLTQEREHYNKSIIDTCREFYHRHYFKFLSFYGCVIISLLALIGEKKNIVNITAVAVLTLGLLFYFNYVGRALYRVEWSVFLCAFMSLLYLSYDTIKEKYFKQYMIILLAMKCVFIGYEVLKIRGMGDYENQVYQTYYYSGEYNPRRYYFRYDRNIYDELNQEIEKNQDSYYFLDFNTTVQTLYLDKPFFASFEEQHYKNYSYITGVTTNYPNVLKNYEINGFSNPIKGLMKENSYFVCDVEERKNNLLTFIKEHYDENAEFIEVKKVNGISIYQLILSMGNDMIE